MRYMITFHNNSNASVVIDAGGSVISNLESMPSLMVVELDEDTKSKLENHPDIKYIEEDTEMESDATITRMPNVSVGYTYAFEKLKIREFWERGFRGQGVRVAVMDSGANSPYLSIAGGINAFNPSIPFVAGDNAGHGTHVSGIIAGQKVLGIAPDVELYIIRTRELETDSITTTAQIVGLDFCIQNGIHIVNCSFSGTGKTEAGSTAYQRASDAGVIIVCSAGNTGNENLEADDTFNRYPASFPFTITIANITKNDVKNTSSSTGDAVNFTCYGTDYLSTTNDGGHGYASGTSMSTPCFAGVLALYKNLFPNLTRDQLFQKVRENARKLWNDEREWTRAHGYGVPGIPPELLALPKKQKAYETIAFHNGTDLLPLKKITIGQKTVRNFT